MTALGFVFAVVAATLAHAQATCTLGDPVTGQIGPGASYAEVSYSVSSAGSGAYGVSTLFGPPGAPGATCAGAFNGSASGTCRWTFSSGGSVQFRLDAGGQGGSCEATSGAATVPDPPGPTPTPTATPTPTPAPTISPTQTQRPTATPIPGQCALGVPSTGQLGPGVSYADVGYSVTIAGAGGYGISALFGPPGMPGATCAGSFNGSASGTCRWTFSSGGSVQFRLEAGGQGGQCAATSVVATVPPPPPPTPTPTATATPTATPRVTPTPGGQCALGVPSTGVLGPGDAFADVPYSVTLAGSGGYGISTVSGPPGAPGSGCAGAFQGGASGTCRWIFHGGGPAQFHLSAGSQAGNCQATSVVANIPDPPPPTPTPTATPIDDAVVDWSQTTLPASLACGESFLATVAMTNRGNTVWTEAGGYRLGAVADKDPFTEDVRVHLPADAAVRPGETHVFSFRLTAPSAGSGPLTTDWRMVRDGYHWFGGTAEQNIDFECPCGTAVCPAGCAAVPSFQLSAPDVVAGDDVTFTALTGVMPNTLVTWDYGDLTRCVDCPPVQERRYTEPGAFMTRLTAIENVCGTVQSSEYQRLGVKPRVLTKGNGATMTRQDFPASMRPGQRYTASIELMNTGTTTWRAGAYHLVAASGPDLFGGPAYIELTEDVPTLGRHTFQIPLIAPSLCGTPNEGGGAVHWRMGEKVKEMFGDHVRASIAVVEDCAPRAGYRCDARVADGYDRPIPNVKVFLEAWAFGEFVETGVDFTNEEGWARPLVRTQEATFLKCYVLEETFPPRTAWPLSAEIETNPPRILSRDEGYLVLKVEVAPTADAVRHFDGLRTDAPFHGQAEGRLYLGADRVYDKVVVMPEGLDFGEQNPKARTEREQFWFQLSMLLKPLHRLGYDVWLVEPYKTGENIHEQAAEYAQALQMAATFGGGPPGGKVIATGYSLGGLVTRLATARWEGDPAWRAEVGLPDDLPARLIAFGDAPLRGANASIDIVRFLWENGEQSQFNLDSCAAQQLLRLSCQSAHDCSPANHIAFYSTGGEVAFYSPGSGTCDRRDGPICFCDAGPAVYSVNGDGFADRPTVAVSAGTWTPDYNQCYGGRYDQNAEGSDLCPRDPGGSGPYVPSPGGVWGNLRTDNCPFGDQEFRAWAPDLEAGSRFPQSLEGMQDHQDPRHWYVQLMAFFGICGGDYRLTQNWAPTFIPIRSALSAEDRDSVPFGPGNWMESSYQASHNRPPNELLEWLIGTFERAMADSSSDSDATGTVGMGGVGADLGKRPSVGAPTEP